MFHHEPVIPEDESFLPQLAERSLDGLGELLVHGEVLAVPVERRAQLLQLVANVVAFAAWEYFLII